MRTCLLLSLCLSLTACLWELPDDVLEPNDRLAEATVLVPGIALRGRAVEGDPDVFVVHVEDAGWLVFDLRHVDLDCCIGLELRGPDDEVLLVVDGGCPLVLRPEVQADHVRFEAEALRNDFQIVVGPARPGLYQLSLVEGRVADGLGTFAWDYELRARVE